ncbi:putative ABC1 protein [Trypanosoma grayi]|uniref:putative ABC1 protein n=1 Tax=Trypanosoma grayi TaxID=71804 RepID=UPI0004F4284E|nr:putative ABC1 protein [Trypanosoma grayi]KEG08297.1 putative ABC1 protein [Trypanosoma grayi]
MISRSGTVRSWCNVSQGVTKILAAVCGDVFSSSRNNNNNNNTINNHTAVSAGGEGHAAMRPGTVPSAAVAHLRNTTAEKKEPVYRAVPSTRAGRAVGFASLFMQLGWDHLVGTQQGGLLSSHSHERIVNTLCRMRGAVLKLGQMLSIQDAATVPPHITQIFERVRDSAYAMPREQLDRTLAKEYHNSNWRKELFVQFDDEPMAAASIGQVHRAVLKGKDGAQVEEAAAVKVQYPGVARSIDSDVSNLKMLITLNLLPPKVQYPGVARSIDSDVSNLKMLITLNLLPPGMFVDNILQELREELALECRYSVEAEKQMRYAVLIQQDPQLRETFIVPKVYESLSTDSVLVTELITGVPIDRLATVSGMQELKNYVAQRMFLLTLSELFRWHFMQTDPNYSNFLFDATTNKIGLLDFGAAREYSAEFVQDYIDVVAAAAREDRDTIIEKSIKLGFLTGHEMKEMLDAHVQSVVLLGKPFRYRDKPFDFAAEHLPSQIQAYVPTMIKLRLRPPPTPVYSLHRRLSGTILLATKLKATVNVGDIFWDIYDNPKM